MRATWRIASATGSPPAKALWPRVEEQADLGARRSHQAIDLPVALDDRAHVVMECHAHAEIGHPLGERGELAAHTPPSPRRRGGAGSRSAATMPSWRPARRVGVDDDPGADIAQQGRDGA